MRILTVDVGMGTNDVLLFDPASRPENQVQLVVPSTTRVVAGEIIRATRAGRKVVFRGALMGGGPSTSAMGKHVEAGLSFFAEPAAARTFSDDLEEVAEMGVEVVSEEEAARLGARDDATVVESGDLRLGALLAALEGLGAPRPDGIAVAVQDHGEAPRGTSDRVFRFRLLGESLKRSPLLGDLFYPRDAVPRSLTRMAAVASQVPEVWPLVLGDTGPAALWGAWLSAPAREVLAINYGNGHTLMSLLREGDAAGRSSVSGVPGPRLDGLFEHHTGLLDAESMTGYVEGFAGASLTGEEVFAAGGHGALPVSRPFGLDSVIVAVTGPNRRRFETAPFPQTPAFLHGAMMTIGCWGLLAAFQAHHPA